MATNVRTFVAGSSQTITLGLGTLGFAFGPGTMAALVRLTNTGAAKTAFSAGATNAASYMLQVDTTNVVDLRLNGVAGLGTTTLSATTWYVIAASKATGSVAPRIHIYDCTAGTWTHENATSSVANSSTPLTRSQFGSTPAGAAFWNGDIQLAAVWSSVLDDTATAALVSLSAFISAAPAGLWILDQAAITTAVTDYTGHGADETAHVGTSVTSVTIPNFDMSYPAVGQTIYPDADVDAGTWATAPLWSKVDEAAAGGDVITATS